MIILLVVVVVVVVVVVLSLAVIIFIIIIIMFVRLKPVRERFYILKREGAVETGCSGLHDVMH